MRSRVSPPSRPRARLPRPRALDALESGARPAGSKGPVWLRSRGRHPQQPEGEIPVHGRIAAVSPEGAPSSPGSESGPEVGNRSRDLAHQPGGPIWRPAPPGSRCGGDAQAEAKIPVVTGFPARIPWMRRWPIPRPALLRQSAGAVALAAASANGVTRLTGTTSPRPGTIRTEAIAAESRAVRPPRLAPPQSGRHSQDRLLLRRCAVTHQRVTVAVSPDRSGAQYPEHP